MDPWRVATGGLAATFIGNGLGRFAYTPLIPVLIAAGWFAPAEASYLAAANLAGYLVGALIADRLSRAMTGTDAIRLAAALTAVSLLACGWNVGFVWYAGWRFLAGVTGGVLMVLAVPVVLAVTAPDRRGRAAGVVITGIGVGITASGLIIPALAAAGPRIVWLALAAAAAALTAYIWFAIPRERVGLAATAAPPRRLPRAVWPLLAAYGCDAIGFIPHTVFWIDFIARALGHGLENGGMHWIVFGGGVVIGPLLCGLFADRFGLGLAFVLSMLAKAAAVGLPLVSTHPAALFASSLIVGMLVSGSTSLCSAWVAELVGLADHRRVWGWMTGAFGVALAGGAWALSHIFALTSAYMPLFAVGAGALVIGVVLGGIALRLRSDSP
ncbi:MAG: YbfB/YjiJ family MFS transporter [Alphaproteobacteria bacterium]|nr:YbfB/YjiJ family MFS transporter [Alphaproteobacteria bacterium]